MGVPPMAFCGIGILPMMHGLEAHATENTLRRHYKPGLTVRGRGHRIPPSFFGWVQAGQFGERVLRWPLIAIK